MNNSSPDMLALVADLNVRRILRVFDAMHRSQYGQRIRTKQDLARIVDVLGPERRAEYVVARQLDKRYREGDLRHSDMELKLIQSLCTWLVAQHAEANDTEPGYFQIDAGLMRQNQPLASESYGMVLDGMAQGTI